MPSPAGSIRGKDARSPGGGLPILKEAAPHFGSRDRPFFDRRDPKRNSAGRCRKQPPGRRFVSSISTDQAALRRPAVLRAAGRFAALLRRALPARFFADFFVIGLRADFAADLVGFFFFATFAMVLSLSFYSAQMFLPKKRIDNTRGC